MSEGVDAHRIRLMKLDDFLTVTAELVLIETIS